MLGFLGFSVGGVGFGIWGCLGSMMLGGFPRFVFSDSGIKLKSICTSRDWLF